MCFFPEDPQFILRHTLRGRLLAILRETSSLHKVFFHQEIDEVNHNARSFPRPSAFYIDQHHPWTWQSP